MKRRTFLAGIGTAGTAALAGCTVDAELASVKARVTGHVGEPRALGISNETPQKHTVTVTVTNDAGQTVFTGERTLPPNTEIKPVWTTTRIGWYTITAETETGRRTTADMRVCVGYRTALVVIHPDNLEIVQLHADPDASACSITES